MIVGAVKSQIDSIWNDFWSGGVSNPMTVMEQITYLLFIKRLDELQAVEEAKASQLKTPMERRIFPEGDVPPGTPSRPSPPPTPSPPTRSSSST